MTTAVLVPPPPSGAAVNVPTKSSSTKTPLAVANNKNTLSENRDGAEERSTCDDANNASASEAVTNQIDNNHDCENANTANLANAADDPNVVAGASATRAAATNRLKRCKSTPEATTSSAKKLKKRRRVSFESADIVEFEPTVFTTTVTSGGIPVGMSLTERSRSRRRLDSWELEREDLRVGRQNYMEEGYLDPAEREQILNNAGCAEQNMLNVEAEVNQIIAHRRESNEVDFDFLYGLVSIGEEEGDDEEEEEEEDEDEEEEEEEEREEEDIEEVQLLSNVGSEDGDVLER